MNEQSFLKEKKMAPQASLQFGGGRANPPACARKTNGEHRKASFNVPLSEREMCVFDCKTETGRRASASVCLCGFTVRLSLPALPASRYTEVNDCIFIVESVQLRHKC